MKNEIKEKKIYNRLGAILAHTDRYAFNPASRLAQDTGLSYTTIHSLLRGAHGPSYYTAIKVTQALEKELKRKLDPREIIHVYKRFPTPIVCDLVKCEGCEFTHDDDRVIISLGYRQ